MRECDNTIINAIRVQWWGVGMERRWHRL